RSAVSSLRLLVYPTAGACSGASAASCPRHGCRWLPNDSEDASDDSQDHSDDEPAATDEAEEREQQYYHAGRHVAMRLHPKHHGADHHKNGEDEADGPVDNEKTRRGPDTDPDREAAQYGREDHHEDGAKQDEDPPNQRHNERGSWLLAQFDPPQFCELYQNTIIKVSWNPHEGNDLSRPHLLSGGICCLVGDSPMVQGYCVKCRAKREISNAVAVILKNGKPAMKGKCPVCGTTIMRIGAAK